MKRLTFSILLLASLIHTAHAQSWEEITPENRTALRALKPTWNELPVNQRQQWLAQAPQLQRMPREQFIMAQNRMAEWASLSQKQRIQVQRKLENDNHNNSDSRAQTWMRFVNQK